MRLTVLGFMAANRITPAQLDGEYRTVGLFVETAKTYIQLATGALLLSVTFSKGVLGLPNAPPPVRDTSLLVSWLLWLIAILFGVTYQYCATKYLEKLEAQNDSLYYHRAKPFPGFRYFVDNPYLLYAVLLVSFYSGTAWFAGLAMYRLID